MSLTQLKDECSNRKLLFNQKDTKKTLIELLIKSDHKRPDWAEIYADLIQFGVGYFEIPNMTVPAIQAIRTKFFERRPFSMGMGFPGLLGGMPISTDNSEHKNQETTQEEVDEFFNDF